MQTFPVNDSGESRTAPRARILVVDDDSIIAGLHAAVLELEDYEVVTSDNGEDALMQLAFGEFDLVLTDRNMPVLDGASMVLALRAAGSHVPVVMVSGSHDFSPLPPEVERELSVALSKPARTAEMLHAVAFALKSEAAKASARPALDARAHVCAR